MIKSLPDVGKTVSFTPMPKDNDTFEDLTYILKSTKVKQLCNDKLIKFEYMSETKSRMPI